MCQRVSLSVSKWPRKAVTNRQTFSYLYKKRYIGLVARNVVSKVCFMALSNCIRIHNKSQRLYTTHLDYVKTLNIYVCKTVIMTFLCYVLQFTIYEGPEKVDRCSFCMKPCVAAVNYKCFPTIIEQFMLINISGKYFTCLFSVACIFHV